MDKSTKGCIFALIILGAYTVHQFTVGGDGVILSAVIGTITGIGGYIVRGDNS